MRIYGKMGSKLYFLILRPILLRSGERGWRLDIGQIGPARGTEGSSCPSAYDETRPARFGKIANRSSGRGSEEGSGEGEMPRQTRLLGVTTPAIAKARKRAGSKADQGGNGSESMDAFRLHAILIMKRIAYVRSSVPIMPPNQSSTNHSHWRCFSVGAFMGCLSSEDVVAVTGIGEHQGQQDDGADQQQRLRRRCGGRLAERDFERHQPRP